MNQPILIQGAIKLRVMEKRDVDFLTRLANNPNVTKNLRDGFPSPYTKEEAEKFLTLLEAQKPVRSFAIEYRGEYVGSISITLGSDVYRHSGDLGYFVGEPYWGKGVATAAVSLITEYGFQTLWLNRISASVFAPNIGSARVLEKCGYTKEGVLVQAVCKNNQFYDEIRYAKIFAK